MLVEALWSLITGLVAGLLSLVPAWSIDLTQVLSATTTAGEFAGMLNGYFPIATLVTSLAVVLGVKVALGVWDTLVFVYKLIPFKAS